MATNAPSTVRQDAPVSAAHEGVTMVAPVRVGEGVSPLTGRLPEWDRLS